MKKPVIVIADVEEQYVLTLEKKIISELQDKVNLEVITEPNYFEKFFSTPRTAEIVVVSEDLYCASLSKHNIKHLFVMTDEIENGSTVQLDVERIYKYTAINEIYNQLIYQSREVFERNIEEKRETRIISFFSACGGTGKTSLSMGVAKILAERYHKVLFVATESVQSFGYYLKDQNIQMPAEGYHAIRKNLQHVFVALKPYIRTEGFSYIPPMMTALDSVGISETMYESLIQEAKKSNEYDYIIVDIEAGYHPESMSLLRLADKIVLVLTPDTLAKKKFEFLNNNIDLKDREKWVYICNKYKENEISEEEARWFSQVHLMERISYSLEKITSLSQMSQLSGMNGLSYLFD